MTPVPSPTLFSADGLVGLIFLIMIGVTLTGIACLRQGIGAFLDTGSMPLNQVFTTAVVSLPGGNRAGPPSMDQPDRLLWRPSFDPDKIGQDRQGRPAEPRGAVDICAMSLRLKPCQRRDGIGETPPLVGDVEIPHRAAQHIQPETFAMIT